jgi:hypothetical protein
MNEPVASSERVLSDGQVATTAWSQAMPTNADLGFRIVNALMSRAAQKIDFTLGSIHVDASGFYLVAQQIHNWIAGQVGVGVEVAQVRPGAVAQYNPTRRLYTFPRADYGRNADEQGTIVHESVHAMNDLRAHTILTATGPKFPTSLGYTGHDPMFPTFLDDEATGFLAKALFLFYENRTITSPPAYVKAFEIARSIANKKKGAVVSAEDAAVLKILIRYHPQYNSMGIKFSTPAYVDAPDRFTKVPRAS